MRATLLLLIVFVAGCQGFHPLQPPGTIKEQRNRAVIHDPFPDNDAGPQIVGGRPRGYEKPLAEPVRVPYWVDSNRFIGR